MLQRYAAMLKPAVWLQQVFLFSDRLKRAESQNENWPFL